MIVNGIGYMKGEKTYTHMTWHDIRIKISKLTERQVRNLCLYTCILKLKFEADVSTRVYWNSSLKLMSLHVYIETQSTGRRSGDYITID